MFAALIAILLLLACLGVIYVLLRNMGQDGVEVAAPTSCKAGRCGVNADCRPAEAGSAEMAALDGAYALPEDDDAEERPRRVA